MSFDLAQAEIRQRMDSMPGTVQLPEPGAFDGFFRGTGMATMRGFAQAGRALDLAANAPALGFAQLTGRYEAIDKFFREREDSGTQRAVDFWTPKPGEVGTAGEVVGSLLSTLPLIIANPAIGITQFGLSQAEEVARKGASPMQATGVGLVMGAGLGTGVWLPILGSTFAQRVLLGGAAFNVAQGVGMRAAAGKIVEGTPAADMFHPLDATEITIDLLLGLAFGGLVHFNPAARAQGAEAQKNIREAWTRLRDWAQNLKPSEIDALATLRMAQHKNADSLPGIPGGPEDVDAHVRRVNRAIEQAVADEPVNVQDIGVERDAQGRIEPSFTPDPERIEAANQRMRELEAEAFRIADEEGIPTPPEQRPVYRAVREALEGLDQKGVIGAPEIDAYARTHQAFYESMARRTGVPIGELLTRYPLKVTGEAPAGNALKQDLSEVFYSALGRHVADAKMKAAPAKGWKDFIRGLGQKGVKPEEVKWSGIEEWLDAQDGRVTKEQVQAFFEAGGVKVEEKMLGGEYSPRNFLRIVPGEHGWEIQNVEGDVITDAVNGRPITTQAEAQRVLREAQEELDGERGSAATPTKFSQYQLPGGQNYRELLLTLPGKPERVESMTRDDLAKWYEQEVGYDPTKDDPTITTDELRALVRGYDAENGAVRAPAVTSEFRSSHFDAPNILAHVRFNERTDAEGKKVLFIEEIQSDWAQKGKKEGFATNTEEYRALTADVERVMGRDASRIAPTDLAAAGHVELGNRWFDALQKANRGGVPSAPFVTNTSAWTALAIKRLIHYAATNGYDRVAWTRGEQQVERYTQALRKAVDALEWEKTDKGIHLIGYKNASTHSMAAQTRDYVRQKVVDTTEKEDALSDAIGKAMAQKIIEDPAQKGSIEGESIKIDDTGMAGYYDRIVPKVVNETLKKLGGGKVGEVQFESVAKQEEASWTVAHTGTKSGDTGTQPGFDITPALIENALKGMPLFQGGDQPRGYFQTGENGPQIGLLANADRSTFLHESGHFFVDVTHDLATAKGAPAELKADWQRTLDWFKVSRETWDSMTLDEKRPHHEKFARGFERYLAEGKAPTEELKGVFERFKEWLLDVYQSLKNLNVSLSDEVRGVMDRMLGADPLRPNLADAKAASREPSMLDSIKSMGGIRKDALPDVTGENRAGRGVKGLPPGLFKEGGRGLDDLATMLRDEGWPIPEDPVDGGVQALKDLIGDELAGKRTQKLGREQGNLMPEEEADAQAVFERFAQLEQQTAERFDFDDTHPDYKAEVNRLHIERDYALAKALSGEGMMVEAEARRISADNPELTIVTGEDANGEPIRKSARELLDDAELEARAIEDDLPLLEVAAECLIGVSA